MSMPDRTEVKYIIACAYAASKVLVKKIKLALES